MQMNRARVASCKYALGILLVLIITYLLDSMLYETSIDPKTKNQAISEALSDLPKIELSAESVNAITKPSQIDEVVNTSTKFKLANITLPSPPNVNKATETQTDINAHVNGAMDDQSLDAKTVDNQALDINRSPTDLAQSGQPRPNARLTEAAVPEGNNINDALATLTKLQTKQESNSSGQNTDLAVLPDDADLAPSKWQIPQQLVNQKLNEFFSLQSSKRALYFPTETGSSVPRSQGNNQTQAILHYMHQCIKIDIGALKNNELMLLTKNNHQRSKIMRLASGQYTKKETALLKSYAPNRKLVRIYPKWFDQNLSRHIALVIGNKALEQLSGTYQLQNGQLLLTNVSVNHQVQNQDWLLNGPCLK